MRETSRLPRVPLVPTCPPEEDGSAFKTSALLICDTTTSRSEFFDDFPTQFFQRRGDGVTTTVRHD